MLDEDTTVELGDFCYEVLQHPHFNSVWQEFEKTACHDLLSTSAPDAKAREEVWNTYNGARQLLQYMTAFVEQRNEIIKQRSIELEDPLDEREEETDY